MSMHIYFGSISKLISVNLLAYIQGIFYSTPIGTDESTF